MRCVCWQFWKLWRFMTEPKMRFADTLGVYVFMCCVCCYVCEARSFFLSHIIVHTDWPEIGWIQEMKDLSLTQIAFVLCPTIYSIIKYFLPFFLSSHAMCVLRFRLPNPGSSLPTRSMKSLAFGLGLLMISILISVNTARTRRTAIRSALPNYLPCVGICGFLSLLYEAVVKGGGMWEKRRTMFSQFRTLRRQYEVALHYLGQASIISLPTKGMVAILSTKSIPFSGVGTAQKGERPGCKGGFLIPSWFVFPFL